MAVGDDLVSYDKGTGLAYHHDGFSSTILNTALIQPLFPGSSKTVAMTHDGDLLQDFDFFGSDLLIRFFGFTGTQRGFIVSPSTAPAGVSWWAEGAGSDLQSTDVGTQKIYNHVGFTTTIATTRTTERGSNRFGVDANQAGDFFFVNWDDDLGGTDLWERQGSLLGTVEHTTFNYDMLGVAYDGNNMIQSFNFISAVLIIRRFVGFSNTTDSDIAEPGTNTGGICHFVKSVGGTRRQRQIKSLIRHRRRRSH